MKMKNALLVILFVLSACGGTLTDEQRKKAKQDMTDHAIKKVSEAQITEAAFALGRSVSKAIGTQALANSPVVDSLQLANHLKIVALYPSDVLIKGIEKQLIDAYVSGAGQVELNDNIQRLGTDSLLYTKPIMKELPDGSLQFKYALGVKMPKREVVLSIKK
jgi:hypothetical protein